MSHWNYRKRVRGPPAGAETGSGVRLRIYGPMKNKDIHWSSPRRTFTGPPDEGKEAALAKRPAGY